MAGVMRCLAGLIFKYQTGREDKQPEWGRLRLLVAPQASTHTLMRHQKDDDRMRDAAWVIQRRGRGPVWDHEGMIYLLALHRLAVASSPARA